MKQIDVSILDAPVQVIAHCCNCFNTMGSGVAAAIREKYPEVYEIDCLTESGNKDKLGRVGMVSLTNPDNDIKFVANMYAQFTFGKDKRQVNYEAIYTCLTKLRDWMIKHGQKTVAFPYKMCCALAGGDWRIIESMINVAFEKTDLEVLICNYQG